MMHFAALAFAIVFAMGIFIWLCLPGTSPKVVATGAFTALTLGAFAAGVESTGQPKPIALEWRNVADAELVGLSWNEDRGVVYVWAMQSGEPMAYVMPWPEDKKKMGELQDKWRRRGASGDEFHFTGDGDVAKVVAPAPMPEKAGQ